MRRKSPNPVEPLESRGLLSSLTTAGLATSLTVTRPLTISGQAVVIHFTETNVGKTALKVDNSPKLDGVVVTESGREVWTSNPGPTSRAIVTKILKPGQSRTTTWTWDGRSNLVTGNPTAPATEGPALTGTFLVTRPSDPTETAKFVLVRSLIYPPKPPTSPPLTGTSLTATITTDKTTYAPGELATIVLTATNPTNHDLSLSYGPSIDGFLAQQNGQTVWSSNGGIQPFFIANEVIHPGQSKTFTATWDGRRVDPLTGSESAPVTGEVTLSNHLFPGQTVTIDRKAS